jgi:hypothetical protein
LGFLLLFLDETQQMDASIDKAGSSTTHGQHYFPLNKHAYINSDDTIEINPSFFTGVPIQGTGIP